MPLTEKQDTLYWRTWSKVVRANGWSESFVAPVTARSDWHQKVFALALSLTHSLTDSRVSRLRTAATIEAIGRPKSHKSFDNAEFDRFLVVCDVLTDPESISAVKDKLAYEEYDRVKAEIARCRSHQLSTLHLQLPDDPGERRRQLFYIRKVPAAYRDAILRAETSYYHSLDFEDFPLEQLRCLTRTLKNRRAQFTRPLPADSETSADKESPSVAVPESAGNSPSVKSVKSVANNK
jgi:hypothetical protein